MPVRVDRNILRVPKRARNAEAASFLAQLDDLSRRMFDDLTSIKAAELAWQPRRGANTIGMLLAHNAIVEVYWMLVATGDLKGERLEEVLGLSMDGDGIPMPESGEGPAHLRGRSLAWYRKLHDRARAFATPILMRMDAATLEKIVKRPRRDGSRHDSNVRWILYHVLEHQAGHYGQMLLLRHLYADRRKRS